MSSISSFGRAAILSMPTNTCRSCQQIRLGAITQQRDFRWKAKPSPETEFAPLDRKIKSKGWPMTPQEDEKYVVATEGKGLEHVGGDKWQEKQFDDKPKYKGWSKIKRANGLSPEDAGKSVIKAAQEAGLDAARLKRLEEDGLDFEIQDSETKFKLSKALRTATNMQIPDYVMLRAKTLKDFQLSIISKPRPKKLSFALLGNQELMANPNLQVRGRRQTPIHKERAVGRWKLIEEELQNQGLPLFGHGIKADRGINNAI